MKTKYPIGIVAVLWVVCLQSARAVSPTLGELAEAREWAAAKFEGLRNTKAPEVGLHILANNDAVQGNGRNGKPLQIADRQYTRGLFCHAVSNVVVRLPGPGKTFLAEAGIDTNTQTAPGRGSVVFSVTVAGKSVFQSALMREGMPAATVQADLGGAREFVLEVGDGGDGIGCDQADWAEARVLLADGQTVWLGDLPISGDHCRPACTTDPFFSFTCDGTSSAELLSKWELKRAARRLDPQRTEHTLTYTDPKTGLTLRCVGIEYRDFPTVEWTLYFKNTGDKDAPVLADIQALDIPLERFPGPSPDEIEFRLHHNTGSPCTPRDYQPHETVLRAGAETRISAAGGRPTNSDLSYFNLQLPTSEGLIVVVGWPGQWAARFTRDNENHLRIRAGQELTHFKLLPGEEVRSPLIVLQFWKGDRIRSQNIWRRWMLAHNLPRPGGKLPSPIFAASSAVCFAEMTRATTENQILFIDRHVEENVKPDLWWMDAGWYKSNKPGQWWPVGTWEVDTTRFPRGLREICDHAHAKGVRTMVWFEPERVAADSWLSNNHPEWLLPLKDADSLLNLGNPQARQWVTDHIDKMITEQGIDVYRQDFNMDPLAHWRNNDAPDRQGITEIGHVTGYLAFWDELRRRHPDMLIDCCASGGRRNDLETLRRAVPFCRSDDISQPAGLQAQTYGIASWIPFYGSATPAMDTYWIRSAMCPVLGVSWDMRRKDLDFPLVRRLIEQWRQIAPCFLGDFYPLTPHNLDDTVWIAWQFDCPESGEGVVQAFRRRDSIYDSARVRLRGLDPDVVYTLTNLDVAGTTSMTGRDLSNAGLPVVIPNRPGAVIIKYAKSSS